MRSFEILTNRQLIRLMDHWELCAGGVTAVALTSRPGTAQRLRTIAGERGGMVNLCLHEAVDSETPSHPRAFSAEMAQETLTALRNSESWGDTLALACDDGRSRSAALAAAWTRIHGRDDLGYWLDPHSYSPNVLVYARLLEAAGFGHVAERATLGKLVKELALSGVIADWGESGKAAFDIGASFVGGDVLATIRLAGQSGAKESELERDSAPEEPYRNQNGIAIALAEHGPMGIAELRDATELPQYRIFDELMKLEDAGIVERVGNEHKRRLTERGRKLFGKD